MEKHYIEIYVDAENARKKQKIKDIIISHVRAKYSKKYGKKIRMHIYKRKNDKYTKNWNEEKIRSAFSEENQKIVKIMVHNLDGKPKKNKVDNQIIEDIQKGLDAHQLCILIASDGDYCEVVEKIHKHDGKICVIGEENASPALKDAADEFITYQYLLQMEKEKRQRDEEERLREKGKKWQEEEKEQKEEKRRKNLITGVQLYIIKLIDNQWVDLRKLKYAVEKKFPEFKVYHDDMSFCQFVEKIYNVEIEGDRAIRKS